MKRFLANTPSGRKGFTLIELLIVIAIILILIAIALPNFLEAQIRARATKAKSELRSLQTCFEAYATDYNGLYPRGVLETINNPWLGPSANWGFVNKTLTTPIPYMKEAILTDLFAVNYTIPGGSEPFPEGHPFTRYRTTRRLWWGFGISTTAEAAAGGFAINYAGPPVGTDDAPNWTAELDAFHPEMYRSKQYMLLSLGPDHKEDACPGYSFYNNYEYGGEVYAPTNGTVSDGDIITVGP